MTATSFSTSDLSSFNRMDYVLYEIHDYRGIPNTDYDDWKLRALANLNDAGFIKLEDNIYVLTEEGREVIKHDSLVEYHKRVTRNCDSDSRGILHELVLMLGKKIWA